MAAIWEGVRVVKYEDREVTYRSMDEMNGIARKMERALGLSDGRPARKVMAHTKGLGGTPTSTGRPWEQS
jgi:hypothetical protein